MSSIIYFDRAADSFEEALPFGSGKLGAMIYGGTENERISINYDELWTGYPRNDNKDAYGAFVRARELSLSGKEKEAEELIEKEICSRANVKTTVERLSSIRRRRRCRTSAPARGLTILISPPRYTTALPQNIRPTNRLIFISVLSVRLSIRRGMKTAFFTRTANVCTIRSRTEARTNQPTRIIRRRRLSAVSVSASPPCAIQTARLRQAMTG